MKLTPLYEVKQIVDKKSHYYTIGKEEKWYPGVTGALSTINKPALVQWSANTATSNIKEYLLEHAVNRVLTIEEIDRACEEGRNLYKKKSQEAADIGSRVHKAIDDIITGKEGVVDDEIKPAVQGFLNWKASHSLTIELGDTKIASKVYGYGGSLDFVAFEGSEPIIFDIKTTKKRKDKDHGIYSEACFQLAAYQRAFQETYGVECKNVYALWINKEKPEFKAVKVSNIDVCFEAFLAALKLFNLSKFEMFEN